LRIGCGQRAAASGAETATLLGLDGAFYEVGQSEKRALDRAASYQVDIIGSLPKPYGQLLGPLLELTGSDKLKKWLLPAPGHMGMFKLPHRWWYKHQLHKICQEAQKVEPTRGDLLILPDAYWARKDVWRAAAAARARGAMVAVVVYDLIPLSHPEFVGQRRTTRFADYLRQVASHADLILTISDTVRRELAATLPELMGDAPYCKEIASFPLGAEFSQTGGQPRSELARLFGTDCQQNPYLMVAAFDPRKNHRYLLDAFDRFWETEPEQKLCLVGRVGSRCDDIMARIKSHPRLGKQLFTFHDLSDAELKHCYRFGRGVIFPSIVEGFGLPIVESLWHGQRTLASDTPIHREVGGDRCLYFDLSTPDSLVELLHHCQRTPHALTPPSGRARPHTWSDSIDVFSNKCLEAYQQRFATPDTQPLARSA
jgi:alpha-1,2-rhamnosyltransferase